MKARKLKINLFKNSTTASYSQVASVAAAAMLGLLLATESSAALSSRDLSSAGDGLITYDSETGLSWLDVTSTNWISYDAVVGGYGGYTTDLGFRLATSGEFYELLDHASIVPGYSAGGWDMVNINNTRALIGLMGVVHTDGHTYYSNGFLVDLTPGQRTIGTLVVNDIGHYGALTAPYSGLEGYFSIVGLGSFLVKESAAPIPEPATMLLLTVGAAVLTAVSRKRARS